MSFACEHVLERLSPFIDKELPGPEATDVARHLAACPPCNGAHGRLTKLEEISLRILRAAPAVLPMEWSARWLRVDGASCNPRAIAIRERRERSARASLARFAVAAVFLILATLAMPLLIGASEREEPGHLCFSRVPGGNATEVLEVDGDVDNYSIQVSYPRAGSNDTVVIMLSKL